MNTHTQAMPMLEKALEYSLAHRAQQAEANIKVPTGPGLKYKKKMDADHAYIGITEEDLPPHEIRYHIAELQQVSSSGCLYMYSVCLSCVCVTT